MRVKPKAAVAAFVLIATAFQAFANEVTLKNGDRVSGKIISRTDEAIVIETEYAVWGLMTATAKDTRWLEGDPGRADTVSQMIAAASWFAVSGTEPS